MERLLGLHNNFSFLFLAVLLFPFQVKSQGNEWNDPSVNEVGAEPRHTSFIYYAEKLSAIKNIAEASPFYKSLNGTWKFN